MSDHAVAETHEAHAAHDDHHADIDKHMRAAYVVFGALLVLTGVTVAVSYLHLPTKAAIALGLAIATLKGGLVVCWFMHLVSEKKLIYAVLAITVVFFFVLLLLPYWTAADVPHIGPPGDPRGPSEQ
jgi:cytochrome c oxidase subunit 4